MKTIIETTCNQISTANTFLYAEKYEFNELADNVEVWPSIVLMPVLMEKALIQTGDIETEHFIQMLFVNKSGFLASSESEKLPIVEGLEAVIDEFITRLQGNLSMRLKRFTDLKFKLIPMGNNFDVNVDGYYFEAKLYSYNKVCL